MLGIGVPELLLVLIAAIIFIGPEKLPDIARALGKGYAEFKRACEEVKRNIEEATPSQYQGSGEEKSIKKPSQATERKS
ncbi:MAG: twin-arginine translocase TatA/TatE family subunit [Deltaproteobacteria bacterium]|nr:twin-arginine translocase TatA/TatE family subunit [Deltaproteobacteria bacterium]